MSAPNCKYQHKALTYILLAPVLRTLPVILGLACPALRGCLSPCRSASCLRCTKTSEWWNPLLQNNFTQ